MNAITWIRDGTLIDRMPENAVAFALAAFAHLTEGFKGLIRIEDLINWAIEKSGISAAEKMRLLNERERREVICDIGNAAMDYTRLAEGTIVDYFPGVIELIRDMAANGVVQYITSAVRQEVLDVWANNPQGQLIVPPAVILGDGSKGQKGKGHFDFVRGQGASKIYAVADARPEIEVASQFADIPVGIAHVITPERIAHAFDQMRASASSFHLPERFKIVRLLLPDEASLIDALRTAGAKKIVTGCREEIIARLREYFVTEGLISS